MGVYNNLFLENKLVYENDQNPEFIKLFKYKKKNIAEIADCSM